MDTADIVIVGGGIVGTSTAFFLAASGVQNVLLLERDVVGAGATGRATGVMLLQGEAEEGLRLQLEAIRIHRQYQPEWGTDLAAHGSLLLWCSPEEAARARQLEPLHARLGISLELLSPAEIGARFPYLATDDVALGTFSAADVWATPGLTVQKIAEAARARGVVIREHAEVTGIDLDAGRVQRVRTRGAAVATAVVVNAAGAWARAVGAMAGARIPVSPRKRQVFVLDRPESVPSVSPFIMEPGKDFYCKSRPEGLIIVQGQTRGETLDATVEWGYLDEALGCAERRLPALRAAPITGAWAGIRPMPPDGRPLLGPVPGIEGYFVAAGFGGQGFTRGPLAGRVLAELITTGRSSLDVSPYRVDRLAHAGRGR